VRNIGLFEPHQGNWCGFFPDGVEKSAGSLMANREMRGSKIGDDSAGKPSPQSLTVHAISVDELLSRLESKSSGLSDDEAERRLKRVGLNRLEASKPVSALRILVDQLRSVVVGLLIAAAVVSLVLGDRIEAAAITVVLIINTVIGLVTELRARRAMAALLQLDVPRAVVLRQGQLRTIDASRLVPGDVVELNTGQHVPADGRVLEESDLRVDEAALTGESLPVSKHAATLPTGTPLADRTNMVYKGTIVVAGTSRVLVTGTGGATELGRIGALVGGVREERTPLERRLDALGHRLVWLALAVATLVSALGAIQGVPWGLVVETGIALAVAAVPEALPAVATIALAVGIRRMARRRALVRRLPAVESLGSTTVVCTDKTRTLTSGEMTVVRIWTAGDDLEVPTDRTPPITPAIRRALEVSALASREQVNEPDGGGRAGSDPVDAALLRSAERFGVDRARLAAAQPMVGLLPFSSARKLMASFHRADGSVIAYVKGAPRQVLELSRFGPDNATLNEKSRGALIAVNETFASAGLRVLALASGAVQNADESALRELAFVGFVGLMDPPAQGVRETIAQLREAGMRTVMLTGDQRLTAEAVGRELGVLSADTQVLGGRELDEMSPRELEARVKDIGAYSRISPEHKLAIVSALQAQGEIVAMLGDGVNDAAALKKSDVGVAMGRRGTDVAKEAASIVLQDDRFETIAAAVEEGRVIFDNIRKFVFYLFSCNVGEVLVVLAAGLAGWPMPLLPLQLLWLNVVTDTFPALALAMEPGDHDVMHRPPRNPQQAILSQSFLASILFYGGLITVSTLGAFFWTLRDEPARAQTVAFMTLAFAQTFHLGNARSTRAVLSLRGMASNWYALAAVAVSIGLQLAAMYVEPLSTVLRVIPLSPEQWLLVLVASAVPAVVGQTLKVLRRAPSVST
jgi:P-type Ca2+ transporter type 2C